MSVEKYILVVHTRVGDAEIELERFRSPVVIERIMREVPTEVFLARLGNYVVLQFSVGGWVEREYRRFEPGDVAYDPMQRALLVFIAPYKGRYTLVGKVTKGLDVFRNAPSPAPVKILEKK